MKHTNKFIATLVLTGLLASCSSQGLDVDKSELDKSGVGFQDGKGHGGPRGGERPEMTDEQKADFETMKTLFDKQRNGEELSEEEEKLLEKIEAKMEEERVSFGSGEDVRERPSMGGDTSTHAS